MFTYRLQLAYRRGREQKLLSAKRLVIGALLGVLFVLCSCARHERNTSQEPAPLLAKAPGTTYPMPPLKSASLGELGWIVSDNAESREVHRGQISDYRGKVLVLDFYATWCEPCRASVPHLLALQRQYEKHGLQVMGLNVGGPEDRLKVPDFASEFHISYPLGFPDRSLEDLLLSDDERIPQTFVLDREGVVVKRFIGYDQSSGVELDSIVEHEIEKETKNAASRR